MAGSAGNVGAHLARVGADGSVVAYPFPAGVPSAGYHIGDVDENGHLWISNNSAWYRIDVSSESSPTYMTLLDSGTVSIIGLADWAHVPGTDALYAVSSPGGTNQLFRFDRATGTATQVADLGLLGSGGGFGASFADADGYLYASQNDTGQIFRIDVDAGTAEFFAPGPASTSNDGAMCADARILLDYGDAPDTYGTTLASDGARHGLRGLDATTSTSPLMLGATVDAETDAIAGAAADGDGADEDAVAAPIVYVPGTAASADVVVTNTTGGVATLAVWVDADRDGTFDEAPVLSPVADGTTSATVTFAVGTLTGEADTYARIRLFPGDVAQPSAVGPASAGEVEDVVVAAAAPALTLVKSAALDDTDADGAADVDEVITYSFLVTNSATAGGDSPRGSITSPPDTATVDTVDPEPGLSLVKTADLDDTDADRVADEGEVITYSFLVTNTGNVTMSDVIVEDPLPGLSPVDCPADVLAPAASMTCTATYTVTEDDLGDGDLENEATATGTPPGGGDPVSSDPSSATTPLADGPPPSVVDRIRDLPRTGASLLGPVGLAAVLLFLGGVLVLRSRWTMSVARGTGRPLVSLRPRGGAHLRRITWRQRLAAVGEWAVAAGLLPPHRPA